LPAVVVTNKSKRIDVETGAEAERGRKRKRRWLPWEVKRARAPNSIKPEPSTPAREPRELEFGVLLLSLRTADRDCFAPPPASHKLWIERRRKRRNDAF